MFIETYRLVRPGREDDVKAALATRRRTNLAAVVTGIVVGLLLLALGYVMVLPRVMAQLPALHSQPLVWIAPFGAAVIVGMLVAWIISRVGERRWQRIKADPDLMRDGFALFDAYAVVPASIPAQDLWDALDSPGGVLSSPVHPRIMAALRSARGRAPGTTAGNSAPGGPRPRIGDRPAAAPAPQSDNGSMDYELDDDPTRIQPDVVWAYLSTDAYWGRWRTREDVDAQLASAWRVVGVYVAVTGEQVGFARAVSDGAGFAYLADVFVLPDHRGHELGKRLVRRMIDEGPGRDFRWMLFTADAHGLYEQFGFAAPDATALVRPSRLG